MKKKSQNFSQDYKMPYLFREDLEDIENIIKDLSPREFKFGTTDFEYKTIQEIPEDTVIRDFNIQIYDPYISLYFSKNSARIYAGDDDIKTLGVIKKITDIIKKRERKLLWQLSRLSNFVAPILLWLPFLLLIFFDKETIKSNKVLFVVSTVIICVIAIAWFIISYRATLKKFSVVEFSYKKNRFSFLTRNKDQIIVGIIVAIATFVLTILSQKILK